ncbi:DUF6191 domain-containing protein [Streptomyces noursei]|uniref:DUF6191 domain-containing protein n=1 Tax=Streptomyces noursei TaxID=1971 RepID=UPI0039AF7EB1
MREDRRDLLSRRVGRRAPGRLTGSLTSHRGSAAHRHRCQREQRRVDLPVQDNQHDGAPPRMGIDLDGGRAVIRRAR